MQDNVENNTQDNQSPEKEKVEQQIKGLLDAFNIQDNKPKNVNASVITDDDSVAINFEINARTIPFPVKTTLWTKLNKMGHNTPNSFNPFHMSYAIYDDINAVKEVLDLMLPFVKIDGQYYKYETLPNNMIFMLPRLWEAFEEIVAPLTNGFAANTEQVAKSMQLISQFSKLNTN